jgi:ABC-type multidrug transport system permease subunit
MDYTNLILGVFALCFGLYMLYLRITNNISNSTKLLKMKELMGDKAGNLVHLIAYTILPIALGIVLLYTTYINSTQN